MTTPRIDPTDRPNAPWRVVSPEALEFVDMFRIKAATGVDVLDPLTRGHMIVACLWFTSLSWDKPLTWAEATRANLDDLILDDGDELLNEEQRTTDEPADPTHGSATPSSESS